MRPTAQVQFRMDAELKRDLEARAIAEGKQFPDWLRDHIMEIKQQYPGRIIEEVVTSPMNVPYSQYPYSSYQSQYPYQQQIDPMTQMVQEMKQMWMAKMMADMITGRNSVESTYAAMRNPDGAKKDDFDMNTFMKYQMIQSQLERQSMAAQQQLASARAVGDKGGENQAVQLIAQIAALQSQQNQASMQQIMAMQQQSNQVQSTLFTTALSTGRQADQEARQQQGELTQQISEFRNQITQVQLDSLNKINQMEVNRLSADILRIQTEAVTKGDLLTQLTKFIDLRNSSPVYKAAFDAAFGVKDESAIGKILPVLKEYGVDKAAERILTFLGGMIAKPKIPSPAEAVIPPPLPIQPMQPLESLKLPSFPSASPAGAQITQSPTGTLPPQPTPPPTYYVPPQTQQQPRPLTETVPSIPPEDQIGYTNINRPEEETVTVEMPVAEETPTETSTIETPTETPAETSTTGEGKSFTVGRKKKPKP